MYGATSQQAWDLAPSFDTEFRHGYQYSEFVYCDLGSNIEVVSPGFFRYSPVNTRLDPATLQPVNGLGLVGFDVLSKTQGDALILSELLLGGCESPTYDISVQTDLWMGIDNHIGTDKPIVPSVTAARLHSPNGDITANAQRIQKNTVLDPTGLEFFIPATTFHNIKLQYRQYIGVQIFKDNGIDNHLGVNLASNKLFEQNLTDDYLPERMGEEFVGAVNGVNAKDYGMPLTPFIDNIRYYDTANPEDPREALYGCGEPIYEISYDNMRDFNQALLLNPDLVYTVKAGDRRITGLTVTVGSNEIVYAPDTFVTVGDSDVGFSLYPFDANKYFFADKVHPDKEIDLNRKYDLGEAIYLNTKLGLDWANMQFTPFPYARRFPAFDPISNDPTHYVKYVKTTNSSGHATHTIPVYIDADLNGRVSMGDIRLTKVADHNSPMDKSYSIYSTVQENDSDAQANLILSIPPSMGINFWYAKEGYNLLTMLNDWNRFNDVYLDIKADEFVSGVGQRSPRDNADIRLSNTFGYGIGSTVYDQQANGLWDAINEQHDDRDVGNWNDPTSNPRYFDLMSVYPMTNTMLPAPWVNWPGGAGSYTISITQDGLFFADVFDPQGLFPWNPTSVQLTPMTVDSRFIRLTEVAISDTTYACGSTVSSGDFWYNQNPVHRLSMGLNCDFRFVDVVVQPGPVSVNIKIQTPFKVEQTSQVDISLASPLKKGEEVWILVQDVWAPDYYSDKMINPFTHVYKLDIDKQTVSFQYTPYRGSCGEFGTNYPLRIYTFKEVGGVKEPVPPNAYGYDFIDPFYAHYLTKDENGNFIDQNLPVLDYLDKIPGLRDTYDCFNYQNFFVLPEQLELFPSQKCLETQYDRFPNLSLRIADADNPADINDPYGQRLALPFGNPLFVNYNATGAGVDYLFTGLDLRSPQKHKVIVQMNTDGTYLYWYWQDEAPLNVLDLNDILAMSPNYPLDPNPELNKPSYIRGYDKLRRENMDCSEKNPQSPCNVDQMPELNIITPGDVYYANTEAFFEVTSYGVPVKVTTDKEISEGDPGGEAYIAVAPLEAHTKLKIRIYSTSALYDYNSTIHHPPFFIHDSSPGIDYCGVKEIKVLPSDPYVNFSEMRIVDHSLQFSEVNYTSGRNAVSPLPVPVIQIQHPYDPIIKDVGRDFRAYPGGNTHTTRIIGMFDLELYLGYPAIWWWYWYDLKDYSTFTDFNKLGMEFMPLTDYGIYFILKNGKGEPLSFRPETPVDRKINAITVEGPFKRPRITDLTTGKVTIELVKGNMVNLPILYDYSGKLVINSSNYFWYEYMGKDWTQWIGFGPDAKYKKKRNAILSARGDLDYTGLDHVIRIDELIPIGAGEVTITVELADGTVKIYQDCCAEPPTNGITSHGLKVSDIPETLEIGVDHVVKARIEEFESFQPVEACNNAYVYIWQDRGIRIDLSKMGNEHTQGFDMEVQFGMNDGYPMGLPMSAGLIQRIGSAFPAAQYSDEFDVNKDGKISFADYETEIMGTYDMASNTWMGGVIDGRTFNANQGQYIFHLSPSNGNQLVDMGSDIGFIPMGGLDTQEMNLEQADHVISDWEITPIYVTAYKYGDDNNDRSFSAKESDEGFMMIGGYSHEVYLAGQARIMPAPKQELYISVSPSVLTAGITPELVDPAQPLTFRVTDNNGRAVDLSKGVDLGFLKGLPLRFRAEPEAIWKHLFVDKHPEPIPQYYWLRTDLHNEDDTEINNKRLFGTQGYNFEPIKIDFTNASLGQYVFRGFCANDAGEFEVYVYSPDRTKMGIAKVKVELPKVHYEISNMEDPSGSTFEVPGDPDFVLTSSDNRIYKVKVTVKDARGLLVKGITKGVSTCGGGTKNTARFTPYTSRPASWNFTERDKFLFADHFMQELYPYNSHIAFDFNDNQQIDPKNAELYTFGGFRKRDVGAVYYNTMNFMNDKLEWDLRINTDLPPSTTTATQKPRKEPPGNADQPKRPDMPDTNSVGWGYGSIYNQPYHGGYLFIDIDHNGSLDYRDSLGLDVNGQTEFYLFAEDIAYFGGLIGQNHYTNNSLEADLVGSIPPLKTDPAYLYRRFNKQYSPDGVFFLDWEAFPDNELVIAPPQFKVLHAQSRIELGKELLNKENYDLTYSVENHIIVQVLPADSRDLAIRENSRVFMLGNQHQTAIYGQLKKTQIDDPKIMETIIHFTPTGLNEAIAHLGFYNLNKYYLTGPYDLKNTSTYTLLNLIQFDAALGLYIEALSDGPIVIKKGNEILVRVKEVGTMAPVENATVKIEGPGISASKQTDKSGIAIFPITASGNGVVKIYASKEGRVIGYKELPIIEDLSKPFLDVYPLAPLTNQAQIEVTGYTNPGNSVTLQGTINATVDEKGNFKGSVTLKEGLNTIIVEARNARGETVKASVTTTLDTQPPNIFIDDPGRLVDVKEALISGRTEPNAEVKLNGKPVTLTHDIFRGTIPVTLGKNTITVEATDQAGNKSTATREIYVYHRLTLKLTIDNPVVMINDEAQPPLEAPPYISRGRTFVPVRIITEAFGANVEWEDSSKTVTITLGDKVVIMQVGNPEALVNGKKVLLDAPPEIRSRRTFVPIRFISEAFGAIVEWDAVTRTVTVIYEK